MTFQTIYASGGPSGACVVEGVPDKYDGGKEYTIKVRCNYSTQSQLKTTIFSFYLKKTTRNKNVDKQQL